MPLANRALDRGFALVVLGALAVEDGRHVLAVVCIGIGSVLILSVGGGVGAG